MFENTTICNFNVAITNAKARVDFSDIFSNTSPQDVFIKKNYLPAALVLLITLKSYEDHVEKSTKRNFRDRDCDRDSRVAIAIVTAIEFSERRS